MQNHPALTVQGIFVGDDIHSNSLMAYNITNPHHRAKQN